jgi:hypothetical protein
MLDLRAGELAAKGKELERETRLELATFTLGR